MDDQDPIGAETSSEQPDGGDRRVPRRSPASPYATGGGGVTLERRIGALYLAALLTATNGANHAVDAGLARRGNRASRGRSQSPPGQHFADDRVGDVGGVRIRLYDAGSGRVLSPKRRRPERHLRRTCDGQDSPVSGDVDSLLVRRPTGHEIGAAASGRLRNEAAVRSRPIRPTPRLVVREWGSERDATRPARISSVQGGEPLLLHSQAAAAVRRAPMKSAGSRPGRHSRSRGTTRPQSWRSGSPSVCW